MGVSVFAADHDRIWKWRYRATIEAINLTGGVPNNPKVITGWLRSRLAVDGKKVEVRDDVLIDMVTRVAQERGITVDEALESGVDLNVNGFKRNDGGLVHEGRCLKAAIKEGFSIALAGGHIPKMGWGATNKGCLSFVAEHVQIPEVLVPICREDGSQYAEPDRTEQRFVSTFRGQGISYADVVDEAYLTFTVEADHDFDAAWPVVWTLLEQNGFGSNRSQGSGKFILVQWDRLGDDKPKRAKQAS